VFKYTRLSRKRIYTRMAVFTYLAVDVLFIVTPGWVQTFYNNGRKAEAQIFFCIEHRSQR